MDRRRLPANEHKLTGLEWVPGESQGTKQAYRMIHQPVSRSLAVFADAWLQGWLAEIGVDLRKW